MIKKYRHKGLKLLQLRNDPTKLPAMDVAKITLILALLAKANNPQQMYYPGMDCHSLTGNYQGYYSVEVRGNWKIIFRFVDGNATDVDYLDYH